MKKKYISPIITELYVDKSIAMMFRSPVKDDGPGGEGDWLGTNTGKKTSSMFSDGASLNKVKISDEETLSRPLSNSSPF